MRNPELIDPYSHMTDGELCREVEGGALLTRLRLVEMITLVIALTRRLEKRLADSEK